MNIDLNIRQATPQDAPHIAPLIYDAIGDIAGRLTGEHHLQNIMTELEELVRADDNRHTYRNTFVACANEQILGIIVLYDGQTGKELDALLMEKLQQKHASSLQIDLEAHDDEYYIDTICVASHVRGLGIGTKLLHFAEEQAVRCGYKKVSLNVDEAKIKARQLYEQQGFAVTEPWEIIGEKFYHMVKEVS
ncbi:GNAT family N-acetyltransferase [Lysinibacillus sp. KU-BSD001]|uniref:GNAT family N-acetyltransferase n=1 Tax=Lysinibacillus sp. KU-BSD001 TaxID=3141328 RepID=UPI0036EB3BC4